MSGTRAAALLLCPLLGGCFGGSVSLTEEAPVAAESRPAPATGVWLATGEVLHYTVAYGGVPAGSLRLEARPDPTPMLTAQGTTNPVFDLVYPVRADVTCALDDAGHPLAFDLDYHENGVIRQRRLEFGERLTLAWRDGDRASRHDLGEGDGTLVDPLGFLWRLRQDAPDEPTDYRVVAGPHPDTYRVTPLGQADVEGPTGVYPDALAYEVAVIPAQSDTPRASFELYLDGADGHTPLLVRRRIGLASLSVELTGREEPAPVPTGPRASEPGPAAPAVARAE